MQRRAARAATGGVAFQPNASIPRQMRLGWSIRRAAPGKDSVTDFQIHDSASGGALRLSLTGELDFASAPLLEARLARLRVSRSPVRLDLSKLEFIDSAAIHLLVQTLCDARIKDWPVEIDPDVSPQVMRLFKLVHLDHVAGWSSG